jgi:hypothetical protein
VEGEPEGVTSDWGFRIADFCGADFLDASIDSTNGEDCMARKQTTKRQVRQAGRRGINIGRVNFNEKMERVFREIPTKGKRVKTNLANILMAERE